MTAISTATSPTRSGDDRRHQLQRLAFESAHHPAVRHPWLRAFSNLEFADPAAALRTYAIEYHGYAAWFPRYLRAVIDSIQDPSLKELLVHNLEEESGHLADDDCEALRALGIHPDSVRGIPHPQLYRRFCRAIGVTDAELAEPTAAAHEWRTRFLGFLENATDAEAVGALGLGTESIVRPVYEQILTGIRRLGTVAREDYLFFELHCVVDDQHQEDLLTCALELMQRPGAAAELRRGMKTALDLRNRFWNRLHGNASLQARGIA